MESRRQNTTERRLAQVRALKDRYFSEELTIEERLEAKDARIALLEGQVAELTRRLDRVEQRSTNATRPKPEQPSPRDVQQVPVVGEQPGFDFYRD